MALTYWQFLLDRVSDPETTVLVGYVGPGKQVLLYRGPIARIDYSDGPLIDVDGERETLCPWGSVRFIECLVPAAIMVQRQDARYRREGVVPPHGYVEDSVEVPF